MLTLESRERDFPSLDGRVYLNTAAEGIPPQQVVSALGAYARDKLLGMDGRKHHESEWNAMRQLAGRELDLASEEIGIASCSSEAFNLAAAALRLIEGDEVVISDLDFPAGTTPWLLPQSQAKTRLWRSRDGALRGEDLASLLGPKTRLVTLSLVSFYNGYRVNMPEVVRIVRQRSDALIAVDVTQAFGRIRMELAEVDLVVSSTHKWLLGVHGGCIVGVPTARAEAWTVPAGGWFNLQDAFGESRFETAIPKLGAASFCLGMPNYAAVYANAAALRYIGDVSVAAIEKRANPLVRTCLDGLKKLGVELLTPDEPDALAGILAFRHPQAEAVHRHLYERGVHIMHHAGRLRVALHGYNTADDVERFLEATHVAIRSV